MYTGRSNLNDKDLMNISWHILTIFVARDINSKWGGVSELKNQLIPR